MMHVELKRGKFSYTYFYERLGKQKFNNQECQIKKQDFSWF